VPNPSLSFEDFRRGLQRLGGTTAVDPSVRAFYERAAQALIGLPTIDRQSLAALITKEPEWAAVPGLIVGLSQEQFKNTLKLRLQTSSWTKLARTNPLDLVTLLDDEFALLAELQTQRTRAWSFADVLLERAGSRSRAGRAITRGRALEDEVEAVIKQLGVPYKTRRRFIGRGGRDAPCDLAIPDAPAGAMIVCAIKGFDSTGSKLTDAVREIESMADVRDPTQFVYAVIDGMGWLSRQGDLRRIYDLWSNRSIDGLYSLTGLAQFRVDLEQAARIRRLL
jgi:hypothetical protein